MTKKTKEVTEKVHTGEDATLYTTFLDRAQVITNDLCRSQITWYHQVGQVFQEFNAALAAKKLGKRTVAEFAADVRIGGQPVGESTLYAARSIYKRYTAADIERLVSQGVVMGHLKLLTPLSDEAQAKLTAQVIGPDGKAVTIEKLNELINKHKQEVARGEIAAVRGDNPPVQTPSAPAAKGTPPRAEEDLLNGDDGDDEGEDANEAEVGSWSASNTADAKPKGDDGKTGSVGMGKPKEFSKSPLKSLKAVENVATKLMASLPDAVIAVKEANQVGFDHPKAQENYKLALANALTALAGLVETAKEVVETMREGVKAQEDAPSGPGTKG